ncbi:hypothetical protein XI25_24285 [Paenibacillus sp. DMB20]|nr:hypothetical protein XI25_24285 [Paenibacillus sp. DMB20]
MINPAIGWRYRSTVFKEKAIRIKLSRDKNMVPLKVAILAAFLFYRYKFLSRAKDKNLYRLPKWIRTCSNFHIGQDFQRKNYYKSRKYACH